MQMTPIIDRYLSNLDVARWLFSEEQVQTISAQSIKNAAVYAIDFHSSSDAKQHQMDIEDMMIVCGASGSFVLGVVYGLSQPHIFATTPLMADKKPLTRRFAVDLSRRHALEFMEFLTFEHQMLVIVYRQFMHTNDQSLPVVVAATLHSPSTIPYTPGPVLMRADLLEASFCPNCRRCGRKCKCEFDSYKPTGAISRCCTSWNQFYSMFSTKAKLGVAKIQIRAKLGPVGDVAILEKELPLLNIIQRGDTHYMNILRRKAVQGLGLTVFMPRTESPLVTASIQNDFVDLHNRHISLIQNREILMPPHAAISATPLLLEDKSTTPITEELIDLCASAYRELSADDAESMNDDAAYEYALLGGHMNTHCLQNPFAVGAKESSTLTANPSVGSLSNSLHLVEPQNSHSMRSLLDQNNFVAVSSPLSVWQSEVDDVHHPDVVDHTATADLFTSTQLNYGTYESHDNDQIVPEELIVSGLRTSSDTSASSQNSSKSKRKRLDPNHGLHGATLSIRSKSSSRESDRIEKRHVCPTCSAGFKMRGDLSRHIRTVHEGKRRYTCHTCQKAFGHSGHLNRHIQSVHLRQRRFECEFCGFKFFQASHLQSHMGHIHDQKKPVECNICGLRLNSHSELKCHRKNSKCSKSQYEPGIELEGKESQATQQLAHPSASKPLTDVDYHSASLAGPTETQQCIAWGLTP